MNVVFFKKIINFFDLSLKEKKAKISKHFFLMTGYFPNIDNPKSFNEKIQWYKLFYKNPLMTKCADKYKVREYVKNIIGEKYLNLLIGKGVYNNFEEIDFEILPEKFVLKTNWGSGQNIICNDKKKLNKDEVKEKLNSWLKPKSNHYFFSYEWCYKDIKPKIICEKYIEENDNDLFDYKFMCFNGKVKMLFVCSDRKNKLKVDFFDLNWNKLPFKRLYDNSLKEIKKPKNLNEMIELAEKLAKPFPFVRVDFYEVENRIIFSELTFYPGNGMEPFYPIEWDYKIGEMLNLK